MSSTVCYSQLSVPLIVLLIVLFPVESHLPGSPETSEKVVKGTVKESQSGNPIRKVKITAKTEVKGQVCSQPTKTGQSGEFRVPILPACSSVDFEFSKGGYHSAAVSVEDVKGEIDIGTVELVRVHGEEPFIVFVRGLGKGLAAVGHFVKKGLEETASAIYRTVIGERRENEE